MNFGSPPKEDISATENDGVAAAGPACAAAGMTESAASAKMKGNACRTSPGTWRFTSSMSRPHFLGVAIYSRTADVTTPAARSLLMLTHGIHQQCDSPMKGQGHRVGAAATPADSAFSAACSLHGRAQLAGTAEFSLVIADPKDNARHADCGTNRPKNDFSSSSAASAPDRSAPPPERPTCRAGRRRCD